MRRRGSCLAYIGFIFIPLLIAGCGSGGGGSIPSPGPLQSGAGIHPEGWVTLHGSTYTGDPSMCTDCHGTDMRGGRVQISCFSASWNGISCHPNGPPKSPHVIPFAPPDLHGPQAKLDLAFCQGCHGVPGTVRFEGGAKSTACVTCHPAANAHPTDWQGTGAYSHRTSGNRSVACAICHNVTAAAPAGPNPAAPSCFSATFANADGQSRSCHSGGPGAAPPHAVPFRDAALHGPSAKSDLSYCQTCHGNPGTTSFTGGIAGVACTVCHIAAKAHPTDWQGSGSYSHRTSGNRDTACAICHNVTAATPAGRDPAAPSCFSAGFTNSDGQNRSCHAGGPGAAAPHAVPFTSPTLHGRPAKDNLGYCQTCHGVPGTTGFSGGAVSVACSSCHIAANAHPTDWQGSGTYSHRSSGSRSTACAICHNVQSATPAGPNPAAPSCYSSSFTNANGQQRSCHSGGP